ncbi:MAG: hypothetical protein U0704_07370 [Candidatus Eisenbacteria bacterium]
MRAFGRIALLLAALAASAVLAGCGASSDLTLPGIVVHWPDEFDSLATRSQPAGAVTASNVPGNVSLLATFEVSGLRSAFGLFTDGLFFVDAGTVQVRAHAPIGGASVQKTLDKLSMLVGASPWYLYTSLPSNPLGVNLAFDGTEHHVFSVSGSGSVAAFTDSVRSVAHPAVTAPANGAAVSRAADLAVSWSDAGSDTTVYVRALLASQVDSSKVAFSELVRDVAGTTTVPASWLAVLPAGSARLSVARWRVAYHGTGTSRTALVCETVELRTLTLN